MLQECRFAYRYAKGEAITIPDEDAQKITTVGEAVRYVEGNADAK